MGVMKLSEFSFAFFASVFMNKYHRVRPALPMGVAPKAIAKNFGYRLKNMDKPVLYTSSCVIC
jgi:hypothetical protein